ARKSTPSARRRRGYHRYPASSVKSGSRSPSVETRQSPAMPLRILLARGGTMLAGVTQTEAVAPDLLDELEALAVELAHLAGAHTTDTLGSEITVEHKREPARAGIEPTNPVSEVDRNVEAIIRERVGQRFPTHAIIGEEVELQPAPDVEYVWVIDPVD